MKATGIVRRIDDLGRVVIPRNPAPPCVSVRGIHWRFYRCDGEVVFKVFPDRRTFPVCRTVCRRHVPRLRYGSADLRPGIMWWLPRGCIQKEFQERRVSARLEELMDQRRTCQIAAGDANQVQRWTAVTVRQR